MSNEELKSTITAWVPTAVYDETGEWLNIEVGSQDLVTLCSSLKNNDATNCDYLFCLTCVDWKTHLTTVYHLSSTQYRHNMVIKCKLDRTVPHIETVSHLWPTAELLEREVYEMFGVHFDNHPDLRLLILPDGWEGKNPLRKDFEDPVNMIRL